MDAMAAMMAAIQAGDYARAHDALQHTAEARTEVGAMCGAFLLALTERFDEADHVARAANLREIGVIVNGERQRTARWRDPQASGGLPSITQTPISPLYAAMGAAFVYRDQALADRTKADLATHARPIAGRLTMTGGQVRPFLDIADCDDAIGQMLETYCGNGLMYWPFAGLRRVDMLPKTNFMDFLMPKAKVVHERATASVYVPLLYACSSTESDGNLRNGRMTMFDYLGSARRGKGQRDFAVDGAMVGLQGIEAIEFA